ncbi:ribosome biogenesis factor YjgA [Denitratimonas sp. CY0512]|uniref:ribosome biogenesis factor YjgA n=1 Tax=Denitratimonas sp. CY0512 TaxID=3131940 RepID=UPI0030A7E31E
MRGRDEETGEFLGPSRSQQRREALEVLELAERLLALGERELAAVPMPDALRDLVQDSRRITAQIARKRQLQFLAKNMRREDDDVIDAIRRTLQRDRDDARREAARLHRLEAWRERLLEEGDEALAELIAQHPDADRQKLRQLVRNARLEREKQRPPHAFRELFRELKTLMAEEVVDEDEAGNTDAATEGSTENFDDDFNGDDFNDENTAS